MKNSKQFAGMIGQTLIELSITEIMKSHIWLSVPAALNYLAGSLWFVAGLSKTKNTNYQITVPFIFNTLISLFAKVTVIALVKAPSADAL